MATTWHLGSGSKGKGAVESTVGLFTHLWLKTPDRDDMVHRHQTMHHRLASTLPGLLPLVTWHWWRPLDVVGGVGHR